MKHCTADVNGVRLHYLAAGDGEPVVLLAGWPQTSHAWRSVAARLAQQYLVIAPDLRGQGASDRPDSGYDADTIVADLFALTQQLGFERVRLAGHGLGAWAAYAYAARHRDGVAQLAVLDAPVPGFVPDALLARVPDTIAWAQLVHGDPALSEMLTAGRERALLASIFKTGTLHPGAIAPPDIEEYLRQHASSAGMRVGVAYHLAAARDEPGAKLDVPVLALGGDASMGEAMGEAMRLRAVDVRSAGIVDSGHFVLDEQPQAVAQQLADFFADGARIRFGVHTFIFTRRFGIADLPLLAQISKHGFDGVEIARYDFDDFPAEKIGHAAREQGLTCTFIAGLGAGLSTFDPDPAVRRKTVEFLQQGVEVGARLGARIFSGPLYAPSFVFSGKRRTQDEWDRGVESFRAVGETLTAHGMRMAIEPLNRYQTYYLTTQADTKAFCEAVGNPRIGVLFDMFHANIEEKDLGASLRMLGSRLHHVHASENDRGTPGSGHNPWHLVAKTLRAMHYDGWVVIESFDWENPAMANATRIWRDLAPRPCDVAWDGLPYLKSTFESA